MQMEVLKLGPWGGEGGYPWSTELGSRLARIRINHGVIIVSLQFQFDRNGELHWTKICGASGTGSANSEILLEDGEYLTCILGHYGSIESYIVVRSLTFRSTIREYGPYGDSTSGTFFCSPQVQSSVIERFYGKSGGYIDSIGVYLRPIHSGIGDTNNEEGVVKLGPWGGEGGEHWSTELGGRLARIRIKHKHSMVIVALQFQFNRNGELHWTQMCGGDEGTNSEIVLTDGEYLTHIYGHFGGNIRSLSFVSNIREYGPYGEQNDTFFCIPLAQGSVIEGFYGRCGQYMDNIGVYERQIPPRIRDTNNEEPDTEPVQEPDMEPVQEPDTDNRSCLGGIFSCLGTCLGILRNGTCAISLGPVKLEWNPRTS